MGNEKVTGRAGTESATVYRKALTSLVNSPFTMSLSMPFRLAALLVALGLLAPAALAQPDLTILSVSSEDPSGDPGDRVSIEYSIANLGNEDADNFEIGYFFSTDQTFSSDDVFAEAEDGGDIDACDGDDLGRGGDCEGDDEDEQITVPSGLDPGNYFILVVADYTDVLFESDETNNTGSVAFRVTGEGGTGSVDGEVDSDDDVDASGGTIAYTVTLTNNTSASQRITAEVNVTLPNGTPFGPIMGPRTVTLPPGQSVTRTFTETVPATAPNGTYRVRLTARANGSLVVSDSFQFTKGDDGDLAPGGDAAARAAAEGAYPNPFREQTAIRYRLEDAADVRLVVYDVLGREVAVLADGPVEAGAHEAVLDGRGLSSGVYVWHLRAGSTVESGQLNLVR